MENLSGKLGDIRRRSYSQCQTKFLSPHDRTGSIRRTASFEYILSDSESDEYNSDDEEDEFLKVYSKRKRGLSSSQISSKLDLIEKEAAAEMLDTIESAFKNLQERTNDMFVTMERVNKKQNKTHNDMRHFIDVIQEMKIEGRALLKRQERISNGYKNIDNVISESTLVLNSSFSHVKKEVRSSEEDEDEELQSHVLKNNELVYQDIDLTDDEIFIPTTWRKSSNNHDAKNAEIEIGDDEGEQERNNGYSDDELEEM